MPVTLTRRELDVMSVVWERGNATVAEVRQGLGETLAYPTVLTMLRILERKGYLRHESEGRAFRYHPRITPDQAGDSVLRRLVAKVYRGSRALLVSRLIADEAITRTELRRIEALLRARLRKAE